MTEDCFPEHKCSLSLEHNQHRNYQQTIERYEADLKACSNADNADPLEFGWVSVEQRDKAIATDSMWCLQWYPDTPIGFYRLFACDLDVLLTAAKAEDLVAKLGY